MLRLVPRGRIETSEVGNDEPLIVRVNGLAAIQTRLADRRGDMVFGRAAWRAP